MDCEYLQPFVYLIRPKGSRDRIVIGYSPVCSIIFLNRILNTSFVFRLSIGVNLISGYYRAGNDFNRCWSTSRFGISVAHFISGLILNTYFTLAYRSLGFPSNGLLVSGVIQFHLPGRFPFWELVCGVVLASPNEYSNSRCSYVKGYTTSTIFLTPNLCRNSA